MALQKKTRGRPGDGLAANPEPVMAGDQAAGVPWEPAPRWPDTVKIEELADNPDNPRESLRKLGELAQAIEEVGVLQRIVVVPREEWLRAKPHHDKPEKDGIGDKPFVILLGHRRRYAAEMAGLTEVPVDVKANVAEQSRRNALIENLQRDDLTVMEEARELDKMMREDNLSQRDAAKTLGKTQGWVSQRIALLKLIPRLQVMVDEGTLKVEEARVLGALVVELQEALADGRLGVEVAREIAKLPEGEQRMPDPAAAASESHPPVGAPDPTPGPEGNGRAGSGPAPARETPSRGSMDGDGLEEARRIEGAIITAANQAGNLRALKRVAEQQPAIGRSILQNLDAVIDTLTQAANKLRTDLEGQPVG